MIEALQTTDARAMILADRETLNLERATNYLVGRLRTRTPLGAVEYLDITTKVSREAFDERCQLAVTKMSLYQKLFPREYAASLSPAFSIQREHEFYRLVASRLFPLDTSMLDSDPCFFWPGIPIKGTQQHRWPNCCPFESCQTVFKIALVLTGMKPGKWRALGLKQEPAKPVAAAGWSLFVYYCMAAHPLMRFLPLALELVCYRTGNPWLDAPPERLFAIDWSGENVAKLYLARKEAEEINLGVLALDAWLDQDPEMVRLAVGLWNNAAKEGAKLEAEHLG